MNELTVKGTQVFMGKEIKVVEGGFGKNQKVVLASDVALIHEMESKRINELIVNNFDEFESGVDILDLCDENFKVVSKDLGFITSNGQKHCYLLSEQGYLTLAMLMRTPKSKEIRKQFVREYFAMRETINSLKLTRKQELALALFEGGLDAITAHKQLVQIETEPLVEKITVLEPKADYHDKVLNANNYLTITEIAKDLGMTGNRLNKILCEIKVQYKKGKKYALYAEHDGKGYVDYKTSLPDDNGVTYIRMCWTEIGRKFIIDKLEKLNESEEN